MNNEVLAVVKASTGRRMLGIGTMGLLGVLLVYVALFRPPGEITWQVFLLAVGFGALWFAETMRRATALTIELTQDSLRCSDGEEIAAIAEVEHVDRGMFAFKPSNGFILKLKTKGQGRWRPGLWWRIGRRVGVGGVTPGSQAKAMAEIIAALMADHQR